ncbi:alginate O-acetyltransferase AlgX-related protein [Desulfomarina sp.]
MMNKMCYSLLILAAGFILATTSFAATLTEVARELAAAGGKNSVVEGTDGWLFLKEELIHVGAGKFWGSDAAAATRTRKKQFADPLPAILAYNKALAAKGIALYLMPVPPKSLIYPDKLDAGLTAEAGEEQVTLYHEFYGLLRQNGVRIIDLLPTLRKKRSSGKQLYCRTDSHFSPPGMELFVDAAVAKIRKLSWYDDVQKRVYTQKKQEISIHGDLARMAEMKNLREKLEITLVTLKETGKPVKSNPKSPVILLGDSHTLVFHSGGDLHAMGAGLFDLLSARLGFDVDLLGVRGSGVTPARIKLYQRGKKDSEYFDGKKVVIWCFTARDFTGSGGWRKIPVER